MPTPLVCSLGRLQIAADAKFADLGADSLAVVEIIMELETQFEIEIEQEDAAKLENVTMVADYIDGKKVGPCRYCLPCAFDSVQQGV